MDFARAQLAKYGWEEGKGLGRNETGIKAAIRPKLKFDNAGIGHNSADTFTYYWWEHAYNAAAKNIDVHQTSDGVALKANDDFEISTRKVSSKKRKNMVFNNFLKSATLTQEGRLVEVNNGLEEVSEDAMSGVPKPQNLTDQELFTACGGRTAHKGARHGLGLSGKLARIEEQERQLVARHQAFGKEKLEKRKKSMKTLVKSIQDIGLVENECLEEHTKVKRKKKSRDCSENTDEHIEEFHGDVVSDIGKAVKSKKRKKNIPKLSGCDELETSKRSENNEVAHILDTPTDRSCDTEVALDCQWKKCKKKKKRRTSIDESEHALVDSTTSNAKAKDDAEENVKRVKKSKRKCKGE